MPQNILERFGINLPPTGGALKLPHVPESIRDFGRGTIEGLEGIATRPKDEEINWRELLGGVLGTGLVPVTGITKFMKAGSRIPDVAARTAATVKNTDRMISAGTQAGARSDDIEKAIKFAERYPRVMAHQDVVHNPNLPNNFAGLNRASPDNQRFRSEIGTLENMQRADPQFNLFDALRKQTEKQAGQIGIPTPQMEPRGIFPFANTLAHETQHTGQRLLNPTAKGLPYSPGIPPVTDPREVAARTGSFRRIYGDR